MVNAVPGELLGRRCAKDKVALDAGVDDLYDDLLVCEADDETVLWCIVLVLCLGDEAFASVVCSGVNTMSLRRQKGHEQSVFPSLRRRYLTWKREKYAFDFTVLTKGI